MKRTMAAFFSSDSVGGLDTMLGDFLKDGDIELINVSHSSCFDHANNYVIFSAAVAYSFVDDPRHSEGPEGPSWK